MLLLLAITEGKDISDSANLSEMNEELCDFMYKLYFINLFQLLFTVCLRKTARVAC